MGSFSTPLTQILGMPLYTKHSETREQHQVVSFSQTLYQIATRGKGLQGFIQGGGGGGPGIFPPPQLDFPPPPKILKIQYDVIIIIGRAKRAPHWGVQSRFRVIYIYVSVVVQNAHAELLGPNARMLKVSIGR